MNINTQDVVTLITVFFYFLVISFELYLPLLAILNDQKKTFQFFIPLSWSVQIIFGYFFYLFDKPNLCPSIYFPIILMINIFAYLKLRKHETEIIPKFDKQIIFYIFLVFYATQAIFYRFYDSFKYVGPGNPDAMAQLVMLQNIVFSDFVGNIFYPPGFHLLILPLAHITNNYGISRFTGPIIGLFILMGIYFLLREKIKLSSRIFLLVLLSFPLFGKFIIQTIGFFPTVISFLIFPVLLFLLADRKINFKQHFCINTILILALAVTAPYFFVQYLLLLVVLFLIVSILSRKRNIDLAVLKRKVILSLFILLIGYLVALGHVILETRVLHKGGVFPTTRTIVWTEQGLTASSNYTNASITKSSYLNNNNIIIKNIVGNVFFRSIILPLANTGLDIIKIKNILPRNTLLNDLGYLIALFSFVLIFTSIRVKNRELLVISTAVFVYGLTTITGFFEMSDYRGRSGFYFFMLAIFLIVKIFDLLKNSGKVLILKNIAIVTIFLSSIYLSIRMPMEFPRLFYPELYPIVQEITNKHSEKTAIISTTFNLAYLSSNIENLDYSKSSLNNSYPLSIVILEKKQFDENNTYKKVVFAHNWDVAKNDPKVLQNKAKEVEITHEIENSDELKGYTLYWQNENVEIFTKPAI